MKIAITGHRPSKLGNDYDLKSDLIKKIRERIHYIIFQYKTTPNSIQLITGMALGIDILFALIAIEMKLPFIAAIPCKNQQRMWTTKSQLLYKQILEHPLCTKHYVSEENYTGHCMQVRNEWMVDNCDLLIAIWDESPGGTANCVNYAKSKQKEIIFINPKEIQV